MTYVNLLLNLCDDKKKSLGVRHVNKVHVVLPAGLGQTLAELRSEIRPGAQSDISGSNLYDTFAFGT